MFEFKYNLHLTVLALLIVYNNINWSLNI